MAGSTIQEEQDPEEQRRRGRPVERGVFVEEDIEEAIEQGASSPPSRPPRLKKSAEERAAGWNWELIPIPVDGCLERTLSLSCT